MTVRSPRPMIPLPFETDDVLDGSRSAHAGPHQSNIDAVRLLFGSFFCFAIAAAVGLGLTYYVLTEGVAFGMLNVRAWTAQPRTGSSEIDPYSRAAVARSGELPVGLGDGVTFIAKADDRRYPLDGRCDVVISGTTPQARYFTLTLYDRDGGLVANAINRYGFTSQELVRRTDGSFEVVVGPRARPGNWLPTGGVERYVLALRLYDTSVGIATRSGRETPMPTVAGGPCP